MEAFITGCCVNIVSKLSSLVAFNLQLVQNALVAVRVLELVHLGVLVFNLVHWRDVFVPCGYEVMIVQRFGCRAMHLVMFARSSRAV